MPMPTVLSHAGKTTLAPPAATGRDSGVGQDQERDGADVTAVVALDRDEPRPDRQVNASGSNVAPSDGDGLDSLIDGPGPDGSQGDLLRVVDRQGKG